MLYFIIIISVSESEEEEEAEISNSSSFEVIKNEENKEITKLNKKNLAPNFNSPTSPNSSPLIPSRSKSPPGPSVQINKKSQKSNLPNSAVWGEVKSLKTDDEFQSLKTHNKPTEPFYNPGLHKQYNPITKSISRSNRGRPAGSAKRRGLMKKAETNKSRIDDNGKEQRM
jgi:hypothetical protein